MSDTPDILKKIIACKRDDLSARKAELPLRAMRELALEMPPPRGFEAALRHRAAACRTAIITEVKKGSPSKGIIRADFDPQQIARTYEERGATCISVLT